MASLRFPFLVGVSFGVISAVRLLHLCDCRAGRAADSPPAGVLTTFRIRRLSQHQTHITAHLRDGSHEEGEGHDRR